MVAIVKISPSAEHLTEFRNALIDGYRLGADFVDAPQRTQPDSHFAIIDAFVSSGNDPRWERADVRFIDEAVAAYVGAAAAHLHGIAALLHAGDPIHLHPISALARGVVEAVGNIWWQIEPLIDDDNDWSSTGPAVQEVVARYRQILARSHFRQLDEMRYRLKRLKVNHDPDEVDLRTIDEAQQKLDTLKLRLATVHGSTGLTFSVKKPCSHCGEPKQADLSLLAPSKLAERKITEIAGESLPDITTRVIAAFEYAYGQDWRGVGINLYPILSGYAHGSIETFYAQLGVERTPPMTAQRSSDGEMRSLVSVALRSFAAGLDMAMTMTGTSQTKREAWEEKFTPLTISP